VKPQRYDGIMASGKMGQWFIGKSPLDRQVNKCATSSDNIHSNFPPSHYSMSEAKTYASRISYVLNNL
jgi:hypothetical protein